MPPQQLPAADALLSSTQALRRAALDLLKFEAGGQAELRAFSSNAIPLAVRVGNVPFLIHLRRQVDSANFLDG